MCSLIYNPTVNRTLYDKAAQRRLPSRYVPLFLMGLKSVRALSAASIRTGVNTN